MIRFVLNADTRFGQDMYVRIGRKEYAMAYVRESTWELEYDGAVKRGTRYEYFMRDTDAVVRVDSPKYRYLPRINAEDWVVEDVFGKRSVSTVFESKAFVECIMRQRDEVQMPALSDGDNMFVLNAPGVESWQVVRLVGNHPVLGDWNPAYGVEMRPSGHGYWWTKLMSDSYLTHVEYKFVIYNRATGDVVKWENGENRRMPVMCGNRTLTTTLSVDYDWHGRGVAIPVFSLRSRGDWGVGQFSDLKYMADWATERGLQLIQILPINDTTATGTDLDSYPYRANSVHALHPMYLDVMKLGVLGNKREQKRFESEGKRLNALAKVYYSAVNRLKTEYIRAIFNQGYDAISEDKGLRAFVKDNLFWIRDYAVFSCLRDEYGTDDFHQWGEYAVYSKKAVEKFCKENGRAVDYYYYVQYNLHLQLTDAIDCVHAKGLVIKGDLPIGISARSVDAWVSPQLFNLDKQAGAPPDDFSVRGQNWGFPTYNWSEMEHSGYQWWKARFATMDRYFDAFRIDHILGFFRIWEIPMDSVWGLMGHFNPAMPLSVQEIENYGMFFDKERYTKPYLTYDYLYSLFGESVDRVASQFMNQLSYDRYELKQDFNTQRKITDCFVNNGLLPGDENIYNKLMELCCDVLLLEDDKAPGYYHPRINLFNTNSYNCLGDHEKWCMRRIHDDFFYYRHTAQWKGEAMRKLPALLNVTDMMVCGEDLGMVPSCVPEVMDELKILSLEVERMPKDVNQRFADLSKVPYLSVCCTGTHDTSTVRSWWKESRENTQWYYNNVLHKEGDAPEELSAELSAEIVDRQLTCRGMWAILPWQDYMASDAEHRNADPEAERINDPSNPEHIWCWRMHLDIN